jgi:hypothetical protein
MRQFHSPIRQPGTAEGEVFAVRWAGTRRGAFGTRNRLLLVRRRLTNARPCSRSSETRAMSRRPFIVTRSVIESQV